MGDAFDKLHATYVFDDDDPSPASIPRPETPTPDKDRSRTLQRTLSHASIETVRPSGNNGVRRRITHIADALKNKARKHKREPLTCDVPKHATHDLGSGAQAKRASRTLKRARRTIAPLRDASQRSEDTVLVTADSIHSGIPSEQDMPSTSLVCLPNLLLDEPILKEDDEPWEIGIFPRGMFEQVKTDGQAIFQPPPKVDVTDVQLLIQPSESDVTIWDGLGVPYHLFKCRLFLRCTTHPLNGACIPDTRRVEMHCTTDPTAGSHLARPPALQASYEGASLGCLRINGLPNITLAAGIHMDRFWRTSCEADGTWGWYREAYIPLSARLFDKAEYRQFKLTSRVWFGENCVEGECIFGVSMLLREVDMR